MQLIKRIAVCIASISAIFISLLSYSSLSHADDVTTQARQTCLRQISHDDNYLDTTHSYITSWSCEPASWFDDFFTDERLYEEGNAATKIRWRNDVVFSENTSPDFITTINARLQLPNTSKRFKLVFESENQTDTSETVPNTNDVNQGTLGFLYDFIDSKKSSLRLRLNLSPSITLRYRYTHSVNETLITRFTQSLYREESSFGTISEFDIDKTIDEKDAIRWSNQIEIVDHLDGMEWITALVWFHRIDEKSAMSYETSATGITEPQALTKDYRLGIRYRRNIYRKWLFYEIAPQVTWPIISITDERHSIFAVTFRLEVFFESI